MKDKVFLDTNILIYSIDASPGQNKKRNVARQILKEHIRNESGVISIQVLQEFYHVATHKIQVPLSTEESLEYLNYMSVFETVLPDFDMVVMAILLHRKHMISFWDALILQAAKTAGCSQVLSEDLQDGFCFDSLRVKNPFTIKS
ncbi:MAG: PIN domain-containing protein [Deltaproteobacteria bacterium]|nr:PIN domain-containing protein [Deltaproteobacteria bacterium]MDL1960168.1 PIN domain-containing protein [Deltaproteobacteria bacterium]